MTGDAGATEVLGTDPVIVAAELATCATGTTGATVGVTGVVPLAGLSSLPLEELGVFDCFVAMAA